MRYIFLWLSSLFLLTSCTVQQQRDVLGVIGTVIPGSSTSRLPSFSSPASPSGLSPVAARPPRSVVAAPPPRQPTPASVKTEAGWVLQTLQRAMTDAPTPFRDCLANSACQKALSAHLLQLQGQADATLELPAQYDQYDLRRAK